MALIVLKTLNQNAYQRIANGEDNGFEAIADLHKALGSPPEPNWRRDRNVSARARIEAVLLANVLGNMLEHENYREEFAKCYMEATQYDADYAGFVFEKCLKLYKGIYFRY